MNHKFNWYFVFLVFVLFTVPGIAGAQSDSGGVLDMLRNRDENLVVVQQKGVPTWISGDLTDTLVKDSETAHKVFLELIPALGADKNTEFVMESMLMDDSNYSYYTFQQFFNSVSIYDSAAKLIVDPEGHVVAITAKVTPIDPKAYEEEKTVDEGTALQIAKDALKELDPKQEFIFTEDMDAVYLAIPVPGVEESEAGTSSKAFYVFYSNNPYASNEGHDMPLMAHYVTMNGIYAASQPCTYSGDMDAMTASDAESFFSHMTPDTWTGTVTNHDGKTREITVPVMKDAKGITYLGDVKRKIVVAECADIILEKAVTESVLRSSQYETWPNKVLMAYENYIKVWDFYNELGWTGPDGIGSPMVILNNYVNEKLEPVDNAVYIGFSNGFHMFATSELNNYCECLDVIGHEFTHAVTTAAMTANLYINEYGAINEAMSDVMGNIIEMSLGGTDDTEWLLAENSGQALRSMSDPHVYKQPEYVGDLYWVPKTGSYNQDMDFGGVHINSSLLNRIAYLLYKEGMTMDELRHLFSGVICGMIPSTGNAEMFQLLLFSARISNLEQFSELINKVCTENGYGIQGNILLRVPENCGRLVMNIPDDEPVDRSNGMLMVVNMKEVVMNLIFSGYDLEEDPEEFTSAMLGMMMQTANTTWADYETGQLSVVLPAGDYTLMFVQSGEEGGSISFYNGARWISMAESGEGSSFATVQVDAGCETWVSNAGLAEALKTVPEENIASEES